MPLAEWFFSAAPGNSVSIFVCKGSNSGGGLRNVMFTQTLGLAGAEALE